MTIKNFSMCPVCGENSFSDQQVLWLDLINAWQLADHEIAYINRQQGFHCSVCNNNLRAMALASAIIEECSYKNKGTFSDFCLSEPEISILEINRAGNLSDFLKNISGHRLVEYPEFDMENLDFPSESFDLIVHSDTLEHLSNPVRGLSECRRVLKNKGKCIFTIPIIVDRLSRSRAGLSLSFHGQSGILANDQVVHSEFGADAWKFAINAGFSSCTIYSFEYPAALVLIAKNSLFQSDN